MSLHTYLFFTNTAREAMTRYQQILGGQLDIMTAADMPSGEDAGDVPADFVIHAALTLGDHDMLMASDDPTGDASGVKGAAIHLGLDSADEVRRVFEALADGGTVDMPLAETFWSPLFGACTDRFGVAWMVDLAAQDV